MRFTIVIPTYNERDCIEACLQSVQNQAYERTDFEIILSDSNSTDGTINVGRNYVDKIVRSDRRGIAHGRNQGAHEASGEILVFLDADVVLGPGYLRTIDRLFQDSQVVGVAVRALPTGGSWFARFIYHGTYLLVGVFNAFGLALFPGVCVAYRRESFVEVGGFREDFGITEDLDLSRRISELGLCKFETRPKAFVSTRRLHKHALSTVLFHIYHDLRYLLTGRTASTYPKAEEITSAMDLWRLNKPEQKREDNSAGGDKEIR